MNEKKQKRNILSVTVDYSLDKENLNFKKLGLYVCTYVDLERILADVKQIKRLDPVGFRYDPGWGFGNDDKFNSPREIDSPQISGEKNNLIINYQGMDRLTDAIQTAGVDIMYVHAYNPIPLQENSNRKEKMNENLQMRSNWNTMPGDMDAWYEVNRRYASHWKGRVKYYEIWNEPDLQPVFFTGSMEDYFRIYRYGALGVKAGDADALVGGPAISFDLTWVKPFLDYIEKYDLPLDFFSYHVYGEPGKNFKEIKEILNGYERFRNLDIFLTEYNSYVPATSDFTINGAIERIEAAPRILHDFTCLAAENDIKSVYWAQFNDPEVYGEGVDRCGLLDLLGNPKPSFGALELLAHFPRNGSKLETDDKDVEGIFGKKENQYHLLIWNLSKESKSLKIELYGMPAVKYLMCMYILDSENPVMGREPLKTQKIKGGNCRIFEELPVYGTIYISLEYREVEKDEA